MHREKKTYTVVGNGNSKGKIQTSGVLKLSCCMYHGIFPRYYNNPALMKHIQMCKVRRY